MDKSYDFEKVGKTYDGSPVYLVRNANGESIGVIERCRASTDTQIAGTRIRRPGKGRNEWRPACGSPRSDEGWEPHRSYMPGLSYLTRSDAADQFGGHWGTPMSDDVIAILVNRSRTER